jgi:hypothetical protein
MTMPGRQPVVVLRLLCLGMLGAGCEHGAAAPAEDAGLSDAGPPDLVIFAPTTRTLRQTAGLAYLMPRAESGPDLAAVVDDLVRIPAAGLRTVRHELLWSEIEPERGRFEFAAYDRLVDCERAAGLEIIGVLGYGVSWATAAGGDPGFPPDAPGDFAAYAAATVAHFKDRVRVWEIWSQENDRYAAWKPREDPAAYGALLTAAATAIRAVDPDALVLLGSLWFHAQLVEGAVQFLADLYAAHPQIGESYDVLGLHAFPTYPPLAAPEDDVPPEVPLPVMVARVRALLEQLGDPKPIAVTAYGWPVRGRVDERRQAAYLVRGAVLLAAAGAERVLWFTWRDGAPDDVPTTAVVPFPPDDGYGLLAGDADPAGAKLATARPALRALETLLAIAGETALVEDRREELLLDERTYAYRFASRRRSVTVVWRGVDDDPEGVPLRLMPRSGATRHEALSMYGEPRTLTAIGASFQLWVGPEPVYLVEQ